MKDVRRRALCLCAAIVLLSLAAPASSHQVLLGDPNDSPGPLDIDSVSEHHSDGKIVITMKTYEPWANELIQRTGDIDRIDVLFNRDEDGRVARYIYIDVIEGELLAEMYGEGLAYPEGDPIAELEVRRPTARSLRVKVPPRSLGDIRHDYRWKAVTGYETIGENDEGYPDCNHEFPPPRPYPPTARCTDGARWVKKEI
jgi:hypothetical protein